MALRIKPSPESIPIKDVKSIQSTYPKRSFVIVATFLEKQCFTFFPSPKKQHHSTFDVKPAEYWPVSNGTSYHLKHSIKHRTPELLYKSSISPIKKKKTCVSA